MVERRDDARGLALIAVLVALSLLLALTAPFLISMGHGDAVSMDLADRKQVELASASARDLVLHRAARTHDSVDRDPSADHRAEFPSRLELPAGFEGLLRDGASVHTLSAETEDLQRRVNLATATPLLIANLLGLSARLAQEHPEGAEEIVVDAAADFPDAGYLVIDRELIRYGRREGNTFGDLERGLLSAERGYQSAETHVLPRDALVLDFRCVLAVTHSFYHQGDDRRDRRVPLRTVDDLVRLGALGFGAFSPREMDVLRAHCTVASVRETAADWGRPERVFEPVDPADESDGRLLRVRSGAEFAGGTVLRIRSLDGKHVEYALCWSTAEVGSGTVNLPGRGWALRLLRPVARPFAQFDTVVEPLLPHPINLNTAPEEVLAAVIQGVRQGSRVSDHRGGNNRPFGRSEAEQLARQLRALRGDQDEGLAALLADGVLAGAEVRPFDGFEDLVRRFFEPHIRQITTAERGRWLQLYRNLRTGRAGELDMGTAPVSFTSAPVVSYRAAALRSRAGATAARLERSGTAVVMPDHGLDLILSTQADFEGRFRLDRQAPYYTTHPINLGSWVPFDPGTTPPSRSVAHVLPILAPDAGLGQMRFEATDGNADGFAPAPSHTPFAFRQNNLEAAQESMWTSHDPEGRNVVQEGPYEMFNRGPRSGGATAPSPPQTGPRAHQPSFSFTLAQGLVGQQSPWSAHAISFWFRPRDAADQMLFDLSADDALRNRISVKIFENELVLEVIDEAGLDDDTTALQRAGTSPERTAGVWRVPLSEIDLQPETWYHVNLSAVGNRPGQLSLLVDGVPRGEPELRTYLTRAIPEYIRPVAPVAPFWNDQGRYLEIMVEDTEGFPPQGVLRIGLELFEYTSKTQVSFQCAFGRGHPVQNSTGGRTARMSLREYFPQIPIDPSTGRPVVNIEQLSGGLNLEVAPPHAAGAAVELYGYAVPVYRDLTVEVGAGRLGSALEPFAVARMINTKTPIEIALQQTSIPLGQGLDANEVVDIELGDPLPGKPQPASPAISSAFSATGGYALLVQVHIPDWSAPGGSPIDIGGIELIRYGARNGTRLTAIQRGLQLPGFATIQIGGRTKPVFDGQSHKFVGEWLPSINVTGGGVTLPVESLPDHLAYVVPISIPVPGAASLPLPGRTEWVQIYPRGGDESQTEWVRYDHVEGDWIVRKSPNAWRELYQELCEPIPQGGSRGQPAGSQQEITITYVPSVAPYPQVTQEGVGYIGYTEQIEVQYPQIRVARRQLQFRGDPFTGTTSHAHPQGAMVLPVHRMELDWGNYGAVSGRVGRNDRVALVGGTQASGSSRPPVEWHTVNWAARRFGSDPSSGAGAPPGAGTAYVELLGPYPFQLVAFQRQVAQLFVGPAQRNFLQDVRLVDRLVKFPSGELPAAAPEDGVFGATAQKDVPELRGLLDELVAVQRRGTPLLLDEALDENGREFVVRKDLLVTPQGDVVINGGDLTTEYPQQGGLLMIDGEILAYESHSSAGPQVARFVIAANGRGLLDPERRAYHHDEGAMVYLLEHVPAAILSAGLNESSHELVVNDMGNLPRDGGTLLVGGTELLHYCWSTGRQLLEMPVWFDPDDPQTRGRGLFRGRYGTTPQSAQAGEPVIWFPFRYWDRYHERADDPELAHFQVTWSLAPVYFKSLFWQEERTDPLLDVHCLVRVDGQGSFADDPAARRGLFLFTDGNPNERPNPLHWQGSRLEARFMGVYRPGAFDPSTFTAHAWKRAAMVRAMVVDYEGESRVLEERITAR